VANYIDPITRDAVLALAQRNWPHRRIAEELQLDRGTVARYVRASRASSPTVRRKSLPPEAAVLKGLEATTRGRKSILSPLRDEIQARLNAGATTKEVHRELAATQNFLGSYYSVLRFVRKLKRTPKCRRLHHKAWMTSVFQGSKSFESLEKELKDTLPHLRRLFAIMKDGNLKARKKALAVLACHKGIPNTQIAEFLDLRRETTRRYCTLFGCDPKALFAPRKRSHKKMDDPKNVEEVVSTLHSPPRAYGINRTTWKQADLQRILREKGTKVSARTIRAILKKQGFRWRKARTVLTSKAPEYREKVEKIKSILGNLGPNERFFSIDEFGPFAITIRGGRKLVAPDEEYTVPQWQKSKGSLIVTAALELCTNQVTHFYSKHKNTDEMIRLVDVLVKEYAGMETIYLSWDAASWHLSKKFEAKVAEINALLSPGGTEPAIGRNASSRGYSLG
jgi:transposase